MLRRADPSLTSAHRSWHTLRMTATFCRVARPRNFATPLTFQTFLTKALETCLYLSSFVCRFSHFRHGLLFSPVLPAAASSVPFPQHVPMCGIAWARTYKCISIQMSHINTGSWTVAWTMATTWLRSGATASTRRWGHTEDFCPGSIHRDQPQAGQTR